MPAIRVAQQSSRTGIKTRCPCAKSSGLKIVVCSPTSDASRLFIFGLGYTGLGLASSALERGWYGISALCESFILIEVLIEDPVMVQSAR